MIEVLVGIAFGVSVMVCVLTFLINPLHAEIVARVEAERDKALNEAKVFRHLLIPALKRAEAEPADAVSPAKEHKPLASSRGTQPASAASTPSRPALQRRRNQIMPFRKFFNAARAATNTPQQRTDALADAIKIAQEFAKQEKKNA